MTMIDEEQIEQIDLLRLIGGDDEEQIEQIDLMRTIGEQRR